MNVGDHSMNCALNLEPIQVCSHFRKHLVMKESNDGILRIQAAWRIAARIKKCPCPAKEVSDFIDDQPIADVDQLTCRERKIQHSVRYDVSHAEAEIVSRKRAER